jgi:hypothetical protein
MSGSDASRPESGGNWGGPERSDYTAPAFRPTKTTSQPQAVIYSLREGSSPDGEDAPPQVTEGRLREAANLPQAAE